MREALSGQMKERQDLEKKLGQQVGTHTCAVFCRHAALTTSSSCWLSCCAVQSGLSNVRAV